MTLTNSKTLVDADEYNYFDEVKRRLTLAQNCEKSQLFRQLEYERCRRDVVHFVSNWVDTFDPRQEISNLPFKLYPFQIETLRWLDEGLEKKKNGLIEKSRDMGVTWVACAWAVHKWLFRSDFIARFGSRKEDLVDDHTTESIFGKLRYIIYRLPRFLRPFGLTKREDSFLYLINPTNQSVMLGESTNVGFGRGGRSSVVFLDEFAHVQHSEAVWASVRNNADCINLISSVNGKGNQFAWLRHESKIRVKTIHWSKHPKKTTEWYERQADEMHDWQIAQELDISYEKSKHGRIYSRFDRRYHIAEEPIPCKPDWEQAVAWDFGYAGSMAMVWLQVGPRGTVEVWNCFELSGQDIDFFVPLIRGEEHVGFKLLDRKKMRWVSEVIAKIPDRYKKEAEPIQYGDNAGTAKTANSTRSCKDAIEAAGYAFKSSGRQGYDWRFECLDNLLKLNYSQSKGQFEAKFIISPDCARMIDCLNNATWDSENIHSDSIKPKNDEFFHMVTALEFFAINRFPLKSHQPRVSSQEWK